MNRKSLGKFSQPVALAMCVLALSMAGCKTSSKQTISYDNKNTSYWGQDGTAPKPAPAPTRAAQPAPAPAPAPAGLVCSNLYYPTGEKGSSAIWLQKCLPAEVSVGESFVSEIRVTNLTNMALTDVVVTDQLPEGYELGGADPVAEGSGKLSWRFAKLDPMATKVIKVTGKATKVGALANCATVSYNTVLCVETRVVQPALVLSKTLPNEVLACDPITMTVKVTNNGSGVARDVKISDNLPEGLTTSDGQKTWSVNAGNLAAGQSRDYTVALKATGPGTYANTATASSGALTVDAKASVVVKKPVLKIVQDCPKNHFIGREICHDVTVTNTGDGVARNTTVVVTLPAGIAFRSATDGGTASGGTVTVRAGDLAPGASKKVTVCAMPAKDGTYKVGAAAQAHCADAVSSSCETIIQGIPAILLEVVDITDPVPVGTNTTYVITATNQGSAIGKNVKIVVNLEEQADFVNADDSATRGTAAGKTITFEPLPNLAVGAKATWKVTVKANKAGDIRFKVEMNEDQLGRPVEETEATNFYDSK